MNCVHRWTFLLMDWGEHKLIFSLLLGDRTSVSTQPIGNLGWPYFCFSLILFRLIIYKLPHFFQKFSNITAVGDVLCFFLHFSASFLFLSTASCCPLWLSRHVFSILFSTVGWHCALYQLFLSVLSQTNSSDGSCTIGAWDAVQMSSWWMLAENRSGRQVGSLWLSAVIAAFYWISSHRQNFVYDYWYSNIRCLIQQVTSNR